MRRINTEILVIGGGATGAGVLRDLAMRGFKTLLVEKNDLSHGTTGRYHGLLHSGGRYAVNDPQAARECIEENRILRRIMPHCIEDTGGFFVITPWDDLAYAPRFVEGCRQAGIPVEEVPISEMLRQEPLLNPRISQCFRVPDGSADSFLGTDANTESASQHGAQVLTYHQVRRLLVDKETAPPGEPRHVVGAICYDRVHDEEIAIDADLVVNASGAWAGLIAGTVGIKVHIIPGKGTMLAMNHRILNTVVNRCKMPSDGDILVPIHTVTVIGTTDVKVADPDHFPIEPWEVHLCLEEGDKLVPGFKDMRMLRAWAGVRPLYQETEVADTRDVTRAFVLLDHAVRDGVDGLVTITSGKWTTYRKMAEVTADLVCRKLGVQLPCRTHLEVLPGADGHGSLPGGYYYLGGRLAHIEKRAAYGDLICECELATRQDVERAILSGQTWSLDDIRRDVRLGMGPCQGGFCTFRAVGLIHELAAQGKTTMLASLQAEPQALVEQTDLALRDFLQERWKGLLPVLWGQQLRQERLDELIYQSVLNVDHLPGPSTGRLSPELYAPSSTPVPRAQDQTPISSTPRSTGFAGRPDLDLLVIGGGLAGLFAAWQAAAVGQRVKLVTKGWGADYWSAGTIDVLGYYPLDASESILDPSAALRRLIAEHPGHPYAIVGMERISAALGAMQDISQQLGYPLHGSLESNWLLPSALGAARPTCLAPQTMIAGDLRQSGEMLLVGFRRFPDFYPSLAAGNLSLQGIPARGVSLDLPALDGRRFVTARVLAEMCASPTFIGAIAAALRPFLDGAARVGFPAVLGFENAVQVQARLQETLGVPVFEIPTLPPSIPGMRLHRLLLRIIREAGGRVYEGMQALHAEHDGVRILQVFTEAAARQKAHRARNFLLATGGLLGGGLYSDYTGKVTETVFGLPLQDTPERTAWFESAFLAPQGHPVYRLGLSTDERLRPVAGSGNPVFANLFAAGASLGGCDPVRERSLEGLALATAYHAARSVLEFD